MEITLREHLKNAAMKRWQNATPEQKSEHARMMLEKRWGKNEKTTP